MKSTVHFLELNMTIVNILDFFYNYLLNISYLFKMCLIIQEEQHVITLVQLMNI